MLKSQPSPRSPGPPAATPPDWGADPGRASCGVGFVATSDGSPSRRIVDLGLLALARLGHRGAVGADGATGDGAGVMLDTPWRLLRREAGEAGVRLPPPDAGAVAVVFLPRRGGDRAAVRAALERASRNEGMEPVWWRQVPCRPAVAGPIARAGRPDVWQLVVDTGGGESGLEAGLFRLRKRAEARVRGIHLEHAQSRAQFSIASLSGRTLVYKGQLTAAQLPRFYPDLRDPELESRMVIFHQRFSTNTEPDWKLAQPFRFLAHNGEINTVRGNRNWMRARAGSWRQGVCGLRPAELLPILEPGASDSADLDCAVELLLRSGRPLPQALLMLIPEAWENSPETPAALRDFYAYHANLLEPWDGPAALAFSDGRVVGSALDRNGLRPLRFAVSRGGLIVLASEAGVVDIPPADTAELGRLQPGEMLVLDLERGALLRDAELKREVASRAPWGRWERERVVIAPDERGKDGTAELPVPTLGDLLPQHVHFGYTQEQLQEVLAPAAASGHESVASMGNDAAPAALSKRPRLLFDFFLQGFAQVTNPPLDHIRERRVMSLRATLGPGGDLLAQDPGVARRVELRSPVLGDAELRWLCGRRSPLSSRTLSLGFATDPGDLEAALHDLGRAADAAVRDGVQLLVLSDRQLGPEEAAVPSLLALGYVHHHLVRRGRRTRLSLVVESGEPASTHDLACLVGHGAEAVNPYLALATVSALASSGELGPRASRREARARYRAALEEGLLKVMSKMGISTLASYCGAQVFEIVGLGPEVAALCFPGTPSRVGGMGFQQIGSTALERRRQALEAKELDLGGDHRWREGAEVHGWSPGAVANLQQAVRDGLEGRFENFRRWADGEASAPFVLRHLMEPVLGPAVPLEEVEPATEIVRRFATGAMSLGSLGPEAHLTLALAMNRLGAKSNTGEGGEDPARALLRADGWSGRSAIKQVASARFGVTIGYLVSADDLQIKIAQGAKPGEGGQLPGHKVDPAIARLRHSAAGLELISPPPHHDIYSIEDLAQLIWDLKQTNPSARVSVKLVAAPGVGTVAAGVVKARADHLTISGQEGGTGAAPRASIKHAGLPWELGLADTQQALVRQGLRSRVAVQVDGGLRTGRDVVVAAMLGAEEFGFGTAALVASGCVLMRACHLNTCPVGIATQDPELRRRFAGTPEHVIRYFMLVAEDARGWLARLGWRSLAEAVGQVERLRGVPGAPLDLSALLAPPVARAARHLRSEARRQALARRRLQDQDHRLGSALDGTILKRLGPRLARGEPAELCLPVSNRHRTVGAMLSGEVARVHGEGGLEPGTFAIRLRGVAGQSLGAFLCRGVAVSCVGAANDYPGKGLSGGRLAVRPPARLRSRASQLVIAGNVALYGATSGEAYFAGLAGERFAVRNSGADAVVEGVGDHGCEYMTGGTVLILGPVGRNFGAGMTGGLALVLHGEPVAPHLDSRSVWASSASPDEEELVRSLLERHFRYTGSARAARLLRDWPRSVRWLEVVRPRDPAARPTVAALAAGG